MATQPAPVIKPITAKYYIEESFDKFDGMTTIKYVHPHGMGRSFYSTLSPVNAMAGSVSSMGTTPGVYRVYGFNLSFGLRHIKSDKHDDILLDYFYEGGSWAGISSGKLIINLDEGRNIELEPIQTRTNASYDYYRKRAFTKWHQKT